MVEYTINREAGNLRRRRAHYDVIVMFKWVVISVGESGTHFCTINEMNKNIEKKVGISVQLKAKFSVRLKAKISAESTNNLQNIQ